MLVAMMMATERYDKAIIGLDAHTGDFLASARFCVPDVRALRFNRIAADKAGQAAYPIAMLEIFLAHWLILPFFNGETNPVHDRGS